MTTTTPTTPATLTITRADLATKRRHGYATRIDGVWHVLTLDKDTGGTVLVPVEVLP